MQKKLMVRCPNCGSFAQRHLLSHHVTTKPSKANAPQVIRTECPHCDYLVMICQEDEEIFSVYSPVMSLFASTSEHQHRQC